MTSQKQNKTKTKYWTTYVWLNSIDAPSTCKLAITASWTLACLVVCVACSKFWIATVWFGSVRLVGNRVWFMSVSVYASSQNDVKSTKMKHGNPVRFINECCWIAQCGIRFTTYFCPLFRFLWRLAQSLHSATSTSSDTASIASHVTSVVCEKSQRPR